MEDPPHSIHRENAGVYIHLGSQYEPPYEELLNAQPAGSNCSLRGQPDQLGVSDISRKLELNKANTASLTYAGG